MVHSISRVESQRRGNEERHQCFIYGEIVLSAGHIDREPSAIRTLHINSNYYYPPRFIVTRTENDDLSLRISSEHRRESLFLVFAAVHRGGKSPKDFKTNRPHHSSYYYCVDMAQISASTEVDKTSASLCGLKSFLTQSCPTFLRIETAPDTFFASTMISETLRLHLYKYTRYSYYIPNIFTYA